MLVVLGAGFVDVFDEGVRELVVAAQAERQTDRKSKKRVNEAILETKIKVMTV